MRGAAAALALALAATGIPAAVAQEGKLAVEVHHVGRDDVGGKMAYFLKDALAGSHRFTLVTKRSLGIRVLLSTVDAEGLTERRGTATTYGVTFVWNNPEHPYDFYLSANAGYCGTDRARSCAESILRQLGTVYEELEKNPREELFLTSKPDRGGEARPSSRRSNSF